MPYKILGSKSETARIIILKESDWSIESNTIISGSGSYEVENLVSGTKTVLSRNTDGWLKGYGSVSPEYYIPASLDRGVFGGGYHGADKDIIDYVTISTIGNATDFGDLTAARSYIGATSNGVNDRGMFGVGNYSTQITYVTISTTGNSQLFGNLTTGRYDPGACSNDTNNRGVWAGQIWSVIDVIDYVTITSLGDATDFGNLTQARPPAGCSNATNDRGVFCGGTNGTGAYAAYDTMDYITISSAGDASDFGDLAPAVWGNSATSNGTNNRGISGGGQLHNVSTKTNVIQYFTISSTGNASDFGDLTQARNSMEAASNRANERGIFSGGHSGSAEVNIIDYITISSTGNASDFGDLTEERQWPAATSN
jgi:hypothetical protein